MTKKMLLSQVNLSRVKVMARIFCNLCGREQAGTYYNFIACRGYREYEGIYDICDDCRLKLLNKLPQFHIVVPFKAKPRQCVQCLKRAYIDVSGYVPFFVPQHYITVKDSALGTLSLYIDKDTTFQLRLCLTHFKARVSPEALVNIIKRK